MINTQIKDSRFHGLSEQLDMLFWKFNDTGTLSNAQKQQLSECANTICCFGQLGENYYKEAQIILNKLSKNG